MYARTVVLSQKMMLFLSYETLGTVAVNSTVVIDVEISRHVVRFE